MYELINKQTGLTEFTGTYDKCLTTMFEYLKLQGAVLSTGSDYFFIKKDLKTHINLTKNN